MKTEQFQKLLLTWFDQHGRKDLPWQKNKTPYRVWVSEIMLQQTQVTTVIPYFQRFMTRFPDVQSLAVASEDDVLHHWTGLGYYTRARNLHRAAKIILEKFHGKFPSKLIELEELPGIGRSTAGAIISIAFKKPAAILDGNVKRVLTRLYGITEWPGEKKTTELLWSIAEKNTPLLRTADYSQAIMDLGATLCVRGKPNCERCPFVKNCVAHSQGIEKQLPKSKPKKTIPIREKIFIILRKNQDCVLLEKRASTGVWGNLWSLPEADVDKQNVIAELCQQRFNIKIEQVKLHPSLRHTFSHFHLDITPVVASVAKSSTKIMEDNGRIWYNLRNPQKIGLPAPVKSLLEKL